MSQNMYYFCNECTEKLLGEAPKPFKPPIEKEDKCKNENTRKKISYTAICEQMPIPHLRFGTYKEAEDYAKTEQPAYRPYYIVKIVEYFEMCGVVGDKGGSEV